MLEEGSCLDTSYDPVLPRRLLIVFTSIHCHFIDDSLRHILMSLSRLLFQFRGGIWF